MRLCTFLFGASLLATAACSPTVEVSRTLSPADAAKYAGSTSLEVSAVVRQQERINVPPNARVIATPPGGASAAPFRVTWNGGGDFVYTLQPGDEIQEDEDQRIIGVTTPSREIHFVPGTASSPAGSAQVRGKLETDGASSANEIALEPHDRVEVHGTFGPGDSIPFGGHVEASRSTGALVGGTLLLVLAYAPSAYVGATSSANFDRSLLIPVAGPWIDFATRAKCVPPAGLGALPFDPCVEDKAARIAVAISGVAQSLGAVLMLIGLPSHGTYSPDDARASNRIHFTIVPFGTGAAAVGTF